MEVNVAGVGESDTEKLNAVSDKNICGHVSSKTKNNETSKNEIR